MMLKM